MAAHDDKISNNRRRLFKALSAAPVVTTLSPGSALAGASSYQCLATPPVATTKMHLGTVTECDTGPQCLAYDQRTYWDSDGLSGDCLAVWNSKFSANEILVNSKDDGTVSLWTVDKTSFAYASFSDGEVSVTGTTLTISMGDVPCTIEGETGLFLLAVTPEMDGDDYVSFTSPGVYPEFQNNAMDESCWNSFDASSSTVKFVKG